VNSNTKRILVIGPAWVGDMVMAQSLFMTLREQYEDAQIDVVAPAWSMPILARMPEVSQGISLPVAHKQLGLSKRWKLGRELKAAHYDQAIVLPRSYKAALVPFFAGIAQRTGYRGEMRYGLINDIRPLDKSVLTRTVQRYVALGLPKSANLPPAVPYPRLKIDSGNQRRLLEQLGLKSDRPLVGLMPGAEYGPAKQWPIDKYIELARRLIARGEQVWVFGSRKEQAMGEQITDAVQGVMNLCGKTSLEDAIDLIALCGKVVTNDSGLMHVACATDAEVIAIYGSSSPDYTPPLSDKATVVYKNLECSPCFDRTCRFGHYNCLENIDVNELGI
jgi:heptosyltransferase-2